MAKPPRAASQADKTARRREAARPLELPPYQPDGIDLMGLFLRKFTEISLLALLLAVPFTYHLSLNQGLLARASAFFDRWEERGDFWFETTFIPVFGGLMPILESKFAAWMFLGSAMIVGYAAVYLFQWLVKRPIFPQPEDPDLSPRRAPHRVIALGCVGGFLVWSLLSLLFWPPELAASAAQFVLPPEGGGVAGWIAGLGGGGFFFSATAWIQVAFALLFFLVCEDVFRHRQLVNRTIGMIILAGFLNAITVILLKVEFGPLMAVWFDWPETETRNNLGGFIGHNTGLSSFLMAPIILTTTLLFSIQPRRNQLLRGVLLTVFLVLALALILAQSRAVLPIVVACVIGLLVVLYRRACLMRKSRAYIWLPVAVAAVILTQVVPARYNPLYREDVTFVERLGEFRPQRLLTETRLRILVVSMTQLVPDGPLAPFIGHGFGSFQYVYPQAQGEYFQENPRSRLVPTPFRTMRAHNEYLQTLVETGLLGLAIGLIGVIFVLQAGWRVLCQTLMPHHLAAQAAIFFSLIALLAHALVDFPFRVPPLALTAVLLLAILSASDRLWLFPARQPVPQDELAEEQRQRMLQRAMPRVPRELAAPAGFACLLLLAVAAGGVLGKSVGPYITAATLETIAASLLSSERPSPAAVQRASENIKAGRRILWISGDLNMTQARANYLRAVLFLQEARRVAAEGQEQRAGGLVEGGTIYARTAITDINQAFAEQNNHNLFRLRSVAYLLLASVARGPEQQSLLLQSIDDLWNTVNMNPGDPEALEELISRLQRDSERNRKDIVRLMGMLHYFHPQYFEKEFFFRVLDALAYHEINTAHDLMSLILQAVPDKMSYQFLQARLAILAGELAEAEEILADIRAQDPIEERESIAMTQMLLAVEGGDFELALALLEEAKNFETVPEALRRTLMLLTLIKMDADAEEQARLRNYLLNLEEGQMTAWQSAGAFAYGYFDLPEEAIYWLQRRVDVSDPPPDAQALVLLSKSYAMVGRWEEVRALIPRFDGLGTNDWQRRLLAAVAQHLRSLAEQAPPESTPQQLAPQASPGPVVPTP